MRKVSLFLPVLVLLLLGAGANANLVSNGDFELPVHFTDWFKSANTDKTNTDNGPSLPGNWCVVMPASGDQCRSIAIAVVEGETYDFQFDYRGGEIRSRVRFFNSDGFQGQKTDFTPTSADWGRQTVQVTIPTGLNVNYVDIVLNATTDDGSKIDNVYFAVPPEYNLNNNLISNGDAEADFQGWYHGSLTVICTTDSASTGTKSFELNNTSDIYTGTALRSNVIAVDPNEPMLLRFSYKTLNGFNLINDDGLRLQVRYFISDDPVDAVAWDDIQLPVTDPNSWSDQEYEIQVPGDPTITHLDLRFCLNLLGGYADGVARFDDIELYNTKCPWVPDQELLANGDFETGDFTNWQTTPRENISISDTVSYEGTYSLLCDPNSEPNAVSKIVHQPMSVVDEDVVFLSLRYMTDPSATEIPISYAKVRFFDSNSNNIGEESAGLTLTGGQWKTFTIDEVVVPDGAVNADIFIRTDCNANLYVDAVSLKTGVQQCYQLYGLDDLASFVSQWLDSDFLPLLPEYGLEDFEGYTDQTAMETSWFTGQWVYPERGESTLTLITDSGQTHGGSRAIRWDYDNAVTGEDTRVWSEFSTILASPIDLSQYDEMHVWLNRHAGNSAEELLYVKFYNNYPVGEDPNYIQAESLVAAAEGSTSSPTGWSEWVIDLNNMNWENGASSLADLDNVGGYFFGAVGDTATQGRGSGTIDFDDIVLVDAIPPCGIAPTWDLSGDCQVNLDDFALFAQDWVGD